MISYLFFDKSRKGNLKSWNHKHENGVPWTRDTFQLTALNGDFKTMKWLYNKECSCGEDIHEMSLGSYRADDEHS